MGENSAGFLHGDLYLHIIEARDIPDMDAFTEHIRRWFTACEICYSPSSARDDRVRRKRPIVSSDAYVTLVVPQCTLARTQVIKNNPNPRWDQKFRIPLAHPATELEFRVKDNDLFGAEIIGTVRIPSRDLCSKETISGWFPILNASGKQPKPDTALHLEMRFIPFNQNPSYRAGAREITDVYFPMRRGGNVKLYQDAHANNLGFPTVELEEGKLNTPSSCWEDICHAVSEAHHLIYIVGWSVFHKIKLVREPTKPLPRGGDLTLGDLLKYKSQEGVRVLLLVWDDKTSHDMLGFKTEGVMLTHDEETKKFFKHSSVTCVLAPRYGSRKLSIVKQQVVGTIFTHHQKCVLLDTQAPGNDRKITAFLGGLDLCDGRYDTPEHRLFRGIDTVFKDDFHNPTFPAGTAAPRQPWHDLHCRVDGPAAYDVLINFEQRWRKATKLKEFGFRFKRGLKREATWKNDALIKIERISWFRCPPLHVSENGVTVVPEDEPSVRVSDEDDPDTWHVQIFRSIDSGSLKGFPKTAKECTMQNVVCAKSLVVDKSIQTAYIQAIRNAQHFIYIENQYFLGSSYAWPSYKDAGADNLIPAELALKIASKIRAGERFAVYVVMPMWPEGNPQSEVVQEILYWQSQTMEMMYRIIAKQIQASNVAYSHPSDYLNFYCLGNREELPVDRRPVNGGNPVSEAYKKQRFMIYVHAKGMIVDDEYVIIGSANINQRSMAGTKDTEIAMGAYQPRQTWAAKRGQPGGQVYGYRMALWGEHLGEAGLLKSPESVECVRTVNRIAEENWRRFSDTKFASLEGHLMKYPLHVDGDGKVSALPGYETFPDVGGSVIGSHSLKLPDTLTT